MDRSAPQAESYFWLGVTGTADGRPEWTTGEPVAYLENSLLRNDISGRWVIRTGGMVMYWPDFSKCNYIIEWER